MQEAKLLMQLLREDRVRSISRLDWLFKALDDHQLNGENRTLFEQVCLFELEHYTHIEDQIAWVKTKAPKEAVSREEVRA